MAPASQIDIALGLRARRHLLSLQRHAELQGSSLTSAPESVVRLFLSDVAILQGLSVAQGAAATVRSYFTYRGLHDPVSPDVFVTPSTWCQKAATIPDPPHFSAQAKRYHDKYFQQKVLRYQRISEGWEQCAYSRGFDAGEPTEGRAAAFLALFADAYGERTVQRAATALQYYFSLRSLDVMNSPLITRFRAGLARTRDRRIVQRLHFLRPHLASLDMAKPKELRLKTIILLSAVAGLKLTTMHLLRREDVVLHDDFVQLKLPKRPLVIKRGSDWGSDLYDALQRCHTQLAGASGPFFPRYEMGVELPVALSLCAFSDLVMPFLRSAGLRSIQDIRRGFIIESIMRVGAIRAARYLSYKNLGSVRYHAPDLVPSNTRVGGPADRNRWRHKQSNS